MQPEVVSMTPQKPCGMVIRRTVLHYMWLLLWAESDTKLLLVHGANPQHKSYHGCTPVDESSPEIKQIVSTLLYMFVMCLESTCLTIKVSFSR